MVKAFQEQKKLTPALRRKELKSVFKALNQRIREDDTACDAHFAQQISSAKESQLPELIDAYVLRRFDIWAKWHLIFVRNSKGVAPYEDFLEVFRSTKLREILKAFSDTPVDSNRLEARVYSRLLRWKKKAMERVRKSTQASSAPSFGHNLDRLRKEKGWSLDKLADVSGVDKKLILNHINHGGRPHPITKLRYAKALGVTVADLER